MRVRPELKTVKTKLSVLEKIVRVLRRGPLTSSQIRERTGAFQGHIHKILTENHHLFNCLRQPIGEIPGRWELSAQGRVFTSTIG